MSRKRNIFLALLLLVILLASCMVFGREDDGLDFSRHVPAWEGLVSYADAPLSLNPFVEGNEIAKLLTGFLTGSREDDGGLRFYGSLAQDLPAVSEDGRTWTFIIREGLTFSDGTPIDANTFVYSMRMWLDPISSYESARRFFSKVRIRGAREYAAGTLSWQNVGINAPNSLTLAITLEEPVPFPLGLYVLNIPALHFGFYEAGRYDDALNIFDFPVSGPYRVFDFAENYGVNLELNISYPNSHLFTDERLIIRFDDNIRPSKPGSPWFLYLNTRDGPLADRNLRKALYHGLNRVIFSEYFTPLTGFVPPNSLVGNPRTGLRRYGTSGSGFNPALALGYFNKAFEGNGNETIRLTITVFEEAEEWGAFAVSIRDQWMELFGGIDRFHLLLEIVLMEEAYAAYKSGDFDMGFGSFTHSEADVFASMAVWTSYYPSKIDSFFNRDFDSLQFALALGEMMNDYYAKAEALVTLEQMLLDYMPAIPLFMD